MERLNPESRMRLEACFRAAVAAVEPQSAIRRALASCPAPASPPVLIAVGKAAAAMTAGCLAWLQSHGIAPADGLLISHLPGPSPHPALTVAVGDHPVPGPRSFAAAEGLGALIDRLPPQAPVLVLLSGGTSALVGAPLPGNSVESFTALFAELLGNGEDIVAVNRRRRQVARWAGGRLGLALAGHAVSCFVISDVPGDDLATIGSGPLVPDETAAPLIPHRIIASAREAVAAASRQATLWGGDAVRHDAPLTGDAVTAAAELVAMLAADRPPRPVIHCWGGETTVALPADHGLGGRCQQFALAAAAELANRADRQPRITILAAGTDGRDGPTDAAGAVVDETTWQRIAAAGRDPAHDLRRCNAHPALDAVGMLVRTGSTGTNVADIVLAEVWPD